MSSEKDPAPAKADVPAKAAGPVTSTAGKMAAIVAERERRRKELERQNARRAHKPNLKTIPWKK